MSLPTLSSATASAAHRAGLLERLRTRLLGERDVVEEQLRDIARQGSGMSRAAHVCALALIVLFSAGSLVALSGDALASILREWAAGGLDIPAAISVAVSTLLVLCMDVGMLYAAAMLAENELNGVWAVRRDSALGEYLVHVEQLGSDVHRICCTCFAGSYGRPCKHTGAVLYALRLRRDAMRQPESDPLASWRRGFDW